MIARLLLLTFCLLSARSTFALDADSEQAPTLPLTLDMPTALRMADRYNPQLRQARERINESKSAYKVTRSNLLPDLNATAMYQKDDDGSIGSFGGSAAPDDYLWRAGIDITQPLYSGGKLRAATRARELESEAVEYDVQSVRARVLADIYRKYYDALLAQETLRVQQESLELITRQFQIASNRYAAGAGAKFDVLQAEVRRANAKPPLIRAASHYKTAIDDLRTSIGVNYAEGMGPTNISLHNEWKDLPLPGNLDDAISQAMNHRPELQSNIKLRDAAEENLKKIKADRQPSINFFAGYGVENDRFTPGNDTLEGWKVGVQAEISLWGGGEVSGEIARSQSQLNQRTFELEAQKLDVELEVRFAWNKAEEFHEILAANELIIVQAEEALRMAENRYRAGALTQLDVLTSELGYTQSRLEQITAFRNYNLAVIEFQRAIGIVPGLEHIKE